MLTAVAAAAVLLAVNASGQTTSSLPGPSPEAATDSWSFTASAYTYLVPDSQNYVKPNLAADRGWLHPEARYSL
jgi:hypothetical protein